MSIAAVSAEFRAKSRTWFHYEEFGRQLALAQFDEVLRERYLKPEPSLYAGESLFLAMLERRPA